jgi:hypothetical protein
VEEVAWLREREKSFNVAVDKMKQECVRAFEAHNIIPPDHLIAHRTIPPDHLIVRALGMRRTGPEATPF